MVAPFASAADLSARGWSGTASPDRVDEALRNASTFLRAEIGWQVYPPAQVVTTAREWTSTVRLSGAPIRRVHSVMAGDRAVDDTAYEVDGALLHLTSGSRAVCVTYDVGYDSAPDELVAWTCVLAADELARAGDPDDAGGARPASESLADWRVTYSRRQQEGDLPIPQRVLDRLRSAYGTTAYVTS